MLILAGVGAVYLALFPIPALAQGTDAPTQSTAPGTVTLANPLGEDANDPRKLIARIIQAIIAISGGIALVMFIYAGLLFLTAMGNEGQVKKAKDLMLYVVLGIVIIAGAFVATNTIFTAVLTGDPVVEGANTSP